MRFSVFHRLEIKFKATNVAEINTKSFRSVKTPKGFIDLGTFVISSSDGDVEAWRGKAIIKN